MYSEGVTTIINAVRKRGIDGDYRDLGDIRTDRNGPLLLFNYTKRAQYVRRWNAVERAARGLIIDTRDCSIAALPFEKFFNLGEMDDTKSYHLPTGPVEITDKADGSLGILYWLDDEPYIATRGAFRSPQAQWAMAWLRKHADVSLLRSSVTALFEIIYPENRVVLDYGQRAELVLIGARDRETGRDYSHDDLVTAAVFCDMPVVHRLPYQSIDELLPLAQNTQGIEGWVVRYPNGLRVKVKCDDYLRLHRIIFGLTPERVREALMVDWTDFVSKLPEEFRPEVEAQANAMQHAVDSKFVALSEAMETCIEATNGDTPRKAFAQQVMQRYPDDAKYLFALLNGRLTKEMVLKHLDLTAVLVNEETTA